MKHTANINNLKVFILLTPNLTKHLASEHSSMHGRRGNKLSLGLQSKCPLCFFNLWGLQRSWKRKRYWLSIPENCRPRLYFRQDICISKKCWSLRHSNFTHFKNNHSSFTAFKNPFSQKSLFLHFERISYAKYMSYMHIYYINTTYFFLDFSWNLLFFLTLIKAISLPIILCHHRRIQY